jgi:hypothetical protein
LLCYCGRPLGAVLLHRLAILFGGVNGFF